MEENEEEDLVEFYGDLTDRQLSVVNHFLTYLGSDLSSFQYVRSQALAGDYCPIDVAIFGPKSDFNYYTITTVGLNHYLFDENFSRVELCMLLPGDWKVNEGDKPMYNWPIRMLKDIAYHLAQGTKGPLPGMVCLMSDEEGGQKPYEYTDAIGGIICFPEMFPFELFQIPVEISFTELFQVVPINKDALSKIDEMGAANYIKYELHDAEGPNMVVQMDLTPQKKAPANPLENSLTKSPETAAKQTSSAVNKPAASAVNKPAAATKTGTAAKPSPKANPLDKVITKNENTLKGKN